jgi:hypothetical protein
MRFVVMHKTSDQWEAGAIPSKELIQQVGQLMGELHRSGVLLGGEGLRASSEGARVLFKSGKSTVTRGPFRGGTRTPRGFVMFRAATLDEAIETTTKLGQVLGEVEIDVRPVTEAWDIGIIPKPADAPKRRYLALYKGEAPPPPALDVVLGKLKTEGTFIASERFRPTKHDKRIHRDNARPRHEVVDGPFTESKELISGYAMVNVDSVNEAVDLAD